MVEHHIQRGILRSLMAAPSLRFSELKPDGMESNIFMYHIRQLQKQGYIAKSDGGYQLLFAGLQYVDRLRMDGTVRPSVQPKVIAIIVLTSSDGQVLLVQRKQQPYIGQYMFFSGHQHFGESPTEQVSRELQDLGLLVTTTYAGLTDIQITVDNAPLTHVVAHVHTALYDGAPPLETDQFKYQWVTMADTTIDLMPGTSELYAALSQRTGMPLTLEIRAADH